VFLRLTAQASHAALRQFLVFLLAMWSLHLNEPPAIVSDWTEERDEPLLNLFRHAALLSDVGVATSSADLQGISKCLNSSTRGLGREGVLGNGAKPCASD
jgi:hypothetical protein